MLSQHMVAARGLVAIALLGACGADGGDPSGPPPPTPAPVVATVEIDPASELASFGETATLSATARDADADPISGVVFAWSALDPAVVTVNAAGLIRAETNGIGRIVASVGEIADTVTITVDQKVAAVRFNPAQPVLELPGDTVVVSVQPIDALGNNVADAGAVTLSADQAVTVDAAGRVEAVGFGVGTLTATSDGVSSTATVEVIGDRFFLSNGVRIRYELDLPDDSGGPFPVVIWVHGSGMVTRSQSIGTDRLVLEGMAALRYDKRGVGESGGTYELIGPGNAVAGLGRLADDAANAMRFLARLPEIDPDRIGMLGNSQGGWIVPMAALKAPEVTSYVMLWSGPTTSVGLENFYSSLTANPSTTLDQAYAQLPSFSGAPGYDALADVTALEIPGIWLYGELDRSIPMRLDVERLNDLIDAGKPFEVVTYEFGNHGLIDTRVGTFYDVWSEYARFLRDRGILD